MKLIVTENSDQAYERAANMILECVSRKPNAKLGLATGGTAEHIYPYLAAACADFSSVTTVNLDEYCGLAKTDVHSYNYFMNSNLFEQINIDKRNTYVADGAAPQDAEIARFNRALEAGGSVDLQLLGVGVSGHIGFNEPRTALSAGVHIEHLLPSTIAANQRFFESGEKVPESAMTMGMGDVLKAKSIVLVAIGSSKAPAMRALLKDDLVTTEVPVTFLKLHPDATVIIDAALAAEIGI